jgi:hypothetical protein
VGFGSFVEAVMSLFRSLIAVAAFFPQCNVWHWNVGTIRRVYCRELLQGERLRVELDSLHGQAAMLAALLAVCPRLPLGVPFR